MLYHKTLEAYDIMVNSENNYLCRERRGKNEKKKSAADVFFELAHDT